MTVQPQTIPAQHLVNDRTLPFKNTLEKLQFFLVLLYAGSLVLPITYPWLILTVGIVVWLLISFSEIWMGRKENKIGILLGSARLYTPPLSSAIIIFLLVCAVSAGLNHGFKELWASLISFRGIIVYFWAYQAFKRNFGLKAKSIQLMLIGGALAGIWATVQQIFGMHPFTYQYLQGTGFLSGPMAFAGQMQILSMLALAIYLSKGYLGFWRPIKQSHVFVFVMLANLLGVMFASERSAWLGAIIGAFTVALIRSRTTFFKVVATMCVGGGLVWMIFPVFQKRLITLLDWYHDVSIRARMQVWEHAIALFRSHALFGVGILRFPHLYIPEAIVPGRSTYLDHAHSNYIHLLATTGLLGISAYVWLCWSTLSLSWSNLCITGKNQCGFSEADGYSERNIAGLYLGIFGCMVSLFVAGCFEYNFGTGSVRLMQWFVLAMLLDLDSRNDRK